MTVPCWIEVASRRISSQWVRICLVLMRAADQRRERRVALRVAVDEEPLVGQVADARREAEAQQVHQGEDVVGEAGRVGVVLLDAQVGLVVEQAVEHVGGVADRRVDDLGVERRVLVGDVRVELHAGLAARTSG